MPTAASYLATDAFQTETDETPGRVTKLDMSAVSRPGYDVVPPEPERRDPYRELAELRARVVGLETVNASLRLEVEQTHRELDAKRDAAYLCRAPYCGHVVAEPHVLCTACAAEVES